MFHKTLFSTLVASALLLSACSDDASTPTSNTASAPAAAQGYVNEYAAKLPADAETIIAATQAKNPPFEFKDEHGNIIGFDVDIVTAIAADQNMKVNVIDTKWDGILDALSQKSYNLVFGTMGDSAERRSKFAISDVYASAPNVIIVPENSPIKSLKV